MQRIIGVFLPTGEEVIFNSIEEASKETRIQAGYIRMCINQGCKYKRWTFDEVYE